MQDRVSVYLADPLRAPNTVSFNQELETENGLRLLEAHRLFICDEGLRTRIAAVALLAELILAVFTDDARTLRAKSRFHERHLYTNF